MKRLGLLAVGVLLLVAQALLRPSLQAQQRGAGLVLASEGQTGMAADAAIPVLALGAFRGLVVDYLWLRSINLRERGRNFEARQLAEQIGRLQPRLWEVWEYLGHDLAYNVTATVEDPAARWRWIQNGIQLLRDEGIRLNPEAPSLYYMLTRIYLDKVGSTSDDHHLYFKERHAQQMRLVLGDDVDLERIASAPPLEVLLAEDVAAARLASALMEAGELEGPEELAYAVLLTELERASRGGLDALEAPNEAQARFLEVARDRGGGAAWGRLVASLRRRGLEAWYALDPKRMREIDRAWGPLDWRGVDATAIYWAVEGMRAARAVDDVRWEWKLRMNAMLALKYAMRRGRITILADGRIYPAPLVDLVETLDRQYRENLRMAERRGDELAALEEDPRRGRALAHEEEAEFHRVGDFAHNQRMAREDFILEAIVLLSDYGRDAEARRLFAAGARDYPGSEAFRQSFDEFLVDYLAMRYVDPGTHDDRRRTAQLIEGAWTQAFRAWALGQDEVYASRKRLAEASAARWRQYLQGLDEPDAEGRLGLPFREIRQRAIYNAARTLSPRLRALLAEKLGVPVERVEQPPPAIDLPPPRTERRP